MRGTRVVAVLCLLLSAACSSPGGERGLFSFSEDPLAVDHPYPSLRAHDATTGKLRVPAWLLEPVALTGDSGDKARTLLQNLGPMLEELDGAGTTATVRVPLSGEPDVKSLASGLSVLTADGAQAVDSEIAVHDGWIEISPVTTWRAGEVHVVLASGVTDVAGSPCRSDDDLASLLGGDLDVDERARIERAALGAGLAMEDLCLAFAFKVINIEDRIRSLRDMLVERAATEPPTVTIKEILDPGQLTAYDDDDFVARVVYGTFTAPDLRDQDGHLVEGRLTGEEAAPSTELVFGLTIPMREGDGDAPFPVVMGIHGLGGSIESTLPLYGHYLGEAGFSFITIDGVEHGTRRQSGDKPWDSILDVEDPRRSRDAFVQTLSDLLQLRLAISLGLSIDGEGDTLERNEIRWSGGSYGGIYGIMMAAVEPELVAVHSEAAGGPWRDIIRNSDIARLFVAAKLNEVAGFELNAFDPDLIAFQFQYAELAQWIIDAGDVSSYAEHVVRTPLSEGHRARLLMQYWAGETLMPNSASERVARALDVPWRVSGDVAGGVTTVWPYQVEDWGVEPGTGAHGAFWHIPAARQQAVEFLLSKGERVVEPR